MNYDRRGLAITTDSKAAVAALDAAIRGFLAHRQDAGDHLHRALAADAGCAIAHCFAGFALMLLGRSELIAKAQRHAAEAARLLSERGGTARERALAHALELWVGGDMRGSAAALERILAAHPLDALAFKLCYAIRFILGDAAGMRGAVEMIRPAWNGAVPDHGFILGCHAFTLEEAGELEEAERTGREAVDREPLDVWGYHAVAHVLGARGLAVEGIAWLSGHGRRFAGVNNFGRHLAWHEALFHLARRDVDAVLALYDREIRGERTDDYRDVANAASLLWRLERHGVGVGRRWEELADLAERRLADSALVFARLHYLMCLVAAGRHGAAAAMVACLERDAKAGESTQALVIDRVGLAMAELIREVGGAVHGGRPIAAVRAELAALGGSFIQREVFHGILKDAAAARSQAPRRAAEILTPQAA